MTTDSPVATPVTKRLLTTEEVAEILGVEPQTLRRWRTNKSNGPPWIHVGRGQRSVRYDPDDLTTFLESKKRQPNDVIGDIEK